MKDEQARDLALIEHEVCVGLADPTVIRLTRARVRALTRRLQGTQQTESFWGEWKGIREALGFPADYEMD